MSVSYTRWRTGRGTQRWALCLDFPRTSGPDKRLWRRRKRECNGAPRRGWRTPAPVRQAEPALTTGPVDLAYEASYLGLDGLGVLILEQKLDFALAVVGRSLQLGELVSPQHSLECQDGQGWNSLLTPIQRAASFSCHQDPRGSGEARRCISRSSG